MVRGVVGPFLLSDAPVEKEVDAPVPDRNRGGLASSQTKGSEPVADHLLVQFGETGKAKALGEVSELTDRVLVDAEGLFCAARRSKGPV